MKNINKGNSKDNFRFEINKGLIWFGNSFFKFDEKFSNNKKEELIKIFFDKIFEKINNKIDNYNLLIQKLIPVIELKIKDNKDNNIIKIFDLNKNCIGGESKKFILENFITKFNKIYEKNVFEIINEKTENIKNNLIDFQTIYSNLIQSETPLVCGLGAAHVLETALTLHHIWGVPYIPGSSLKGVCRQVAFWKLVEGKNFSGKELEDFQKRFYGELAIDDEEMIVYQLLFGAQDFKGLLLFLDVYPECNNEKIFKLDIMNPHYSKYYGDSTGQTSPGDWENPVPIVFLTVKEGVNFRFVVLFDNWRWEKIKKEGILIVRGEEKYLITNNVTENSNEEEKIKKVKLPVEKVEEKIKNETFFETILKDALSFYGVGSKTRLGYGSFKVQDKAK